jgi:hypothetical protein
VRLGLGFHLGAGELSGSYSGLVGLRTTVVKGDLESDFTGIFSSAAQGLPDVTLTAAGNNNVLEINPRLANQIRLLVIGEHGHLELVVVGRVVDSEAQFLVPSWCLTSSDIGLGLVGFFAESRRAVRILLSNCLAIGQVLGSINNGDESADDGSVNGQVGKDSSRVLYTEGLGRGPSRHDG